MDIDKLNNPTWNSLTETHRNFALDYGGIKFYRPEYCPFGGFINPNATKVGIETYTSFTNNFYVVGDSPIFDEKVQLKKELVCNQMVLDKNIDLEITETITALQTTKQEIELFDLVNLI